MRGALQLLRLLCCRCRCCAKREYRFSEFDASDPVKADDDMYGLTVDTEEPPVKKAAPPQPSKTKYMLVQLATVSKDFYQQRLLRAQTMPLQTIFGPLVMIGEPHHDKETGFHTFLFQGGTIACSAWRDKTTWPRVATVMEGYYRVAGVKMLPPIEAADPRSLRMYRDPTEALAWLISSTISLDSEQEIIAAVASGESAGEK